MPSAALVASMRRLATDPHLAGGTAVGDQGDEGLVLADEPARPTATDQHAPSRAMPAPIPDGQSQSQQLGW